MLQEVLSLFIVQLEKAPNSTGSVFDVVFFFVNARPPPLWFRANKCNGVVVFVEKSVGVVRDLGSIVY